MIRTQCTTRAGGIRKEIKEESVDVPGDVTRE